MVGATAGSGINATKEKASAVTEAVSKSFSQTSITPKPACVFKLPNSDTQAAFVGALLLKGYYLTPPDVIYSFMHLTRLSAVIWDLKNVHGLGERLRADDAPLTAAQRKRKHSKHFAGYWLEADAVAELAEPAQAWADRVLAQYPMNFSKLRTARSMNKLEVAA